MIADGEFYTDTDLVPRCKKFGNNKIMIKGKIVEVSTRAKISNIHNLLIETFFNNIEDADDAANGAGINKVFTTERPKREVNILLVLVVVINTRRFIIDRSI